MHNKAANSTEQHDSSSTNYNTLISRLFKVSNEDAQAYDDEVFALVWKETFPSEAYPQNSSRSEVLSKLRQYYPEGNLKRNNQILNVLSKKRKLEDYLVIVESSDVFMRAEENSHNPLLEDGSTLKLIDVENTNINTNQQFSLQIPVSNVKKVKKDLVEACKQVCTEMKEQTENNFRLEDELAEMKESIPNLQGQITSLQTKVASLEQESNISMAKHILQRLDLVSFNGTIIDDQQRLRTAFKDNAKLLATGRKDLNPSNFEMFKEFKQFFPYDPNFTNYFEEHVEPPTSEISDEEYVKWLCSLFKSLDTNHQTSGN